MSKTPIRMAGLALLALSLLGFSGASSVGQDTPKPDKEQLDRKIEKLIEQFEDRSFRIREAAVKELIAIGRPAVPHLERALESKDQEVRARARTTLDTIRSTLSYLIDEIKHGDAEARKQAAGLLAEKGTEAKEAIPRLLEMTKDKNEEVAQ